MAVDHLSDPSGLMQPLGSNLNEPIAIGMMQPLIHPIAVGLMQPLGAVPMNIPIAIGLRQPVIAIGRT